MKLFKKRKNKIIERDEQIVKVIAYILLSIMSVVAIAPFIILLSASFSSEASIAQYGYGFFPKEFSIDAWKYLWNAWKIIGKAYGVTILITAVGTVLSVMTTSMFAYGLIQKVKGIKLIMALLVVTMVICLMQSLFLIVQSLSHIQLFATSGTPACQASLSFTIS